MLILGYMAVFETPGQILSDKVKQRWMDKVSATFERESATG